MIEKPLLQPQAEVPPSGTKPVPVKKTRAAIESVNAEVVQLNQSNVKSILADSVSIQEGGTLQVNAQTFTATNCGMGIVHASSVNIINGGAGIVSAEEAEITGNVGVMIGQSVQLNNHTTSLVLAREVHGNHIQSILFLAGRSDAPVETIVDQRSVALFGLSLGIALGLVLSIFRLLKHS